MLAVLGCAALLASGITYVLYNHTANLLKQRLQERIVSIVSTISEEISADDVESVQGIQQLDSPELKRLVTQLERLRGANTDVTFAYIMRRTNDINTFEFVADADTLDTPDQPDADEEAPMPGDPFDVAPYPTLRDEAFFHPIAANDLEEDQWSMQLSAYAPILDDAGEAVAIVGVDVVVEDFKQKTQAMLSPFLLFILFLVLLLSLLTVLLVRFYNERVEAVKELDRQKDELLSMVSHQLATPVSSVKWYLEMLGDGDAGVLNEQQKEQIETMQGVIVGLVDLVQMILDVSRIQLDRMKVDLQELCINDLINEIMNVIEPKAEDKKVTLIKSLPDEKVIGNLDRRLMHMVIENLLSNAVKYTPTGGKVTFKVAKSGNRVTIEIKDTGCGIPKDEQGKIFQKLYRASNVRSIDGNGFGLYVAKGAVEAQEGSIHFESTEGQGTTFYVDMPLDNKIQETK